MVDGSWLAAWSLWILAGVLAYAAVPTLRLRGFVPVLALLAGLALVNMSLGVGMRALGANEVAVFLARWAVSTLPLGLAKLGELRHLRWGDASLAGLTLVGAGTMVELALPDTCVLR